MVVVILTIVWLVMVLAGSLLCGGGRPVGLTFLLGLLLGRWRPENEQPSWGEIALVLAGRVGAMLFLLIMIRLMWRADWRESVMALGIALAGLSGLSLLGRSKPLLAGLTETTTLLCLPGDHRLFIGRVAADGPLCGATLAALDLRRRGVLVLAVGRGSDYVHFPKGQEVLRPGDILVAYGRLGENAAGSSA